VTSTDYQSLLAALPYGKRLPGAIYLLDPGDASADLPPKLRATVDELPTSTLRDRVPRIRSFVLLEDLIVTRS